LDPTHYNESWNLLEFSQNTTRVSNFFCLFYDNEVIDLIGTKTNRYALQFFERFPEK